MIRLHLVFTTINTKLYVHKILRSNTTENSRSNYICICNIQYVCKHYYTHSHTTISKTTISSLLKFVYCGFFRPRYGALILNVFAYSCGFDLHCFAGNVARNIIKYSLEFSTTYKIIVYEALHDVLYEY